jgi:hypothetical protein
MPDRAPQEESLLSFIREVTGDPTRTSSEPCQEIIAGLDWQGAARRSAERMILRAYWEPRAPPPLRRFYPGGAPQGGFLVKTWRG